MKEIQPPHKYKLDKFSIFLSGSINMNKSIDWQSKVIKALDKQDIIILNPRRKDWDSSWKQEKENKEFRNQVEWELKGQDDADLIIMYIADDGLSPITLLELGIYHNSKRLVVCCESKYERKGNVDIVCDRYDIPQVKSLDALIEYAKIKYLEKYKPKKD